MQSIPSKTRLCQQEEALKPVTKRGTIPVARIAMQIKECIQLIQAEESDMVKTRLLLEKLHLSRGTLCSIIEVLLFIHRYNSTIHKSHKQMYFETKTQIRFRKHCSNT